MDISNAWLLVGLLVAAVSICTANAVASSTVASSLDQVCTFSIIFGSVPTIGRRATQYADSVAGEDVM